MFVCHEINTTNVLFLFYMYDVTCNIKHDTFVSFQGSKIPKSEYSERIQVSTIINLKKKHLQR